MPASPAPAADRPLGLRRLVRPALWLLSLIPFGFVVAVAALGFRVQQVTGMWPLGFGQPPSTQGDSLISTVLAITMALFYARTLAAVVSAPLALILAGPPEGRGTVVKILAMWVVALTLALPFASVVTWMLD